MKDKKLQIFVSSTYTDLIEERQAAVEAILSSGHIPAGMELFSAGDESQMTVIKRWIDESDVYLLILGGRYGSIEKTSGKSYTHLEYEYALEKQKPLFAVVITESALEIKVKKDGLAVIEKDNSQKLNEFKSIVQSKLVKFWSDTKDIKLAIHETISEFISSKELIGWIRGDNAVNTGFLAEEIARLTKENSDLRNSNKNKETLYAGLTYQNLKELLVSEKINDNKGIYTLYDFLMENANVLYDDFYRSAENFYFQKLILYKIVKKEIRINNDRAVFPIKSTFYSFTDDGQNFYLKSLSLKNEKSSGEVKRNKKIQ